MFLCFFLVLVQIVHYAVRYMLCSHNLLFFMFWYNFSTMHCGTSHMCGLPVFSWLVRIVHHAHWYLSCGVMLIRQVLSLVQVVEVFAFCMLLHVVHRAVLFCFVIRTFCALCILVHTMCTHWVVFSSVVRIAHNACCVTPRGFAICFGAFRMCPLVLRSSHAISHAVLCVVRFAHDACLHLTCFCWLVQSVHIACCFFAWWAHVVHDACLVIVWRLFVWIVALRCGAHLAFSSVENFSCFQFMFVVRFILGVFGTHLPQQVGCGFECSFSCLCKVTCFVK